MNITNLYNKLSALKEIPFDKDTLGEEGSELYPVLVDLSAEEVTLVVTKSAKWEDKSSFIIEGKSKGSLLSMDSPDILFLATQVAEDIEFKVTIKTTNNWKFIDSFSFLQNSEFNRLAFKEGFQFVLSTREVVAEKLIKGLNFFGDLQTSSSISSVLELIPSLADFIAINGEVVDRDDSKVVAIKTIFDESPSLSLPGLVTLKFSSPALILRAGINKINQEIGVSKRIESLVTLEGKDSSEKSVDIPLVLQLPEIMTGWYIMLQQNKEVSLANFLDFLSLLASAGQFDFTSLFSDPSGKLDKIKTILQNLILKNFAIEIIGSLNQSPQFKTFSFDIQSKDTLWEVIKDTLTLTDLRVALQVIKQGDDYQTSGCVQGGIEIANDISIGATIPLPIGSGDWIFRSRSSVLLPNVDTLTQFIDSDSIKQFFPASLSDLPNFNLSELNLVYDPAAVQIKQIEFAIKNENNWVIIEDQFEIATLGLNFSIEKNNKEWGVLGKIQGTLLAGGTTINAEINKPSLTSDWYFDLHADLIPLPNLEDLGILVGNQRAFTSIFPDSVLKAETYLNNPAINLNLNQRKIEFFSFSLETSELDFEQFQVLAAGISVEGDYTADVPEKKVVIFGKFEIENIDFNLESNYSSSEGWQFIGSAGLTKDIPIGDLITSLASKFGVDKKSVPQILTGLELANLQTSFNSQSKDFYFSGLAKLQLNDVDVKILPTIVLKQNQDNSFSKSFAGLLALGEKANELCFNLIFNQTGDSDGAKSQSLLASYDDPSGGKVNLSNLLSPILPSDINIPDVFDFSLKDALFYYQKDDQVSKTLFLAHLGSGIDLASLPLIGKILAKDQKVKLNYQILVSSASYSADEIESLNALLPANIAALPSDKDLVKGLGLATSLTIGDQTINLNLPVSANSDPTTSGSQNPVIANQNTGNINPNVPPASDGVTWVNIQKEFGPVTFNRIGVKYENSILQFLLDTSLSSGGLTLSLSGLTVSSPLTTFDPKFSLNGIGIDFKKPPLEIGGSFLREEIDDPKLGKYEQYSGMAVLKMETFSLSAIGSYAEVKGEKSLFLYGVLDYPLGGPAFFFVTGLAAGFGYNRKLVMPSIENVNKFPLVTIAMSEASMPATDSERKTTLTNTLNSLNAYIPPSPGDMFFTVGVKFTSFGMIYSFALLALSIEENVELNILGLSNMSVPPNVSDTPLGQIEMVLKASFKPAEGSLSIMAQLTENSYILSRNCKLTGGFAFYSWFSGEYAGDFVITLGGYHPLFKIPKHYPLVPRLGFNWQISGNCYLKGDAYFALCSHVLMAGGHLEAVYHSGNFKAWFKAGMDFIISWKPYFYDARIYVSVGASYKINLLFGSTTISAELGADLHLWGPEFAGEATVHIWVVSVTIAFGANSSNNPIAIDWSDFKESFLPKEDTKVITLSVAKGLISAGSTDNDLGIINPKEFSVTLDSVIPIKEVSFFDEKNESIISSANKEFGIGSMAVSTEDLQSVKNINCSRLADDGSYLDVGNDFKFEPILKKSPTGMWGNKLKVAVNDGQYIENSCTGFNITSAKPPAAGITNLIDKKNLQYETSAVQNSFNWEGRNGFQVSSQSIKQTINDSAVAAKRNNLLKALNDVDAQIDVNAAVAEQYLDQPIIEVMV